MTGCCAPNCHNRSGIGKVLFAVPRAKCAAQVRRRLQWLLRMGREKLPPKRARLCEDHFTLDQVEEDSRAGRKRLKSAAVPSIFCAHQRAIVSDNGRSSLAPDKSAEAGLSPSKLGEMPEVSATPDIPAAMILEHLLIPLSTGVTGAQRSVDCSQHSPPASQGILHEVFAALKEKVATMAPEKRHACL
ncbi:hypothetical protein MRX96_031254 [Rhipicephalus microplus]|nr:peroxynitrite isomerase THAP4-like isoform X2 [Rhipicephalus microplus]